MRRLPFAPLQPLHAPGHLSLLALGALLAVGAGGCGREEPVADSAGTMRYALAASVIRGPYLQMGGPGRITVRWRTDNATNSRVRYGLSAASLNLNADVATVLTNHVVTITGLSPSTRYFYSVGSTTETHAGGDANHWFDTAPVSGTAEDTRIWVLGDSGTGDNNAIAVRNAFGTWTGARGADLMVMLGDNAYNDGTDSEYQAGVFTMYPTWLRNTVLWPTLGNHDGHTADSATQSGPYYDIFTLPKTAEIGGLATGTEAYYSFNYGNIHFVCLESYETNRAVNGPMLTWLNADLAANTKLWTIAFWHHPPYSKGSHDSDNTNEFQMIEMRENALPILEAHGVDLVLSGHSHSYERSYLLDGHYGYSGDLLEAMKLDDGDGRENGTGIYVKPAGITPHDGAVYVVAGSSGQSDNVGNHVAHFIDLEELGSMALDVNANRLDARFIRSNGAVTDWFTVLKSDCGVDNTPCNDANACTQNDVCVSGTCAGTPITCTPLDSCHLAGVCNPGTGSCSNPVAPDNDPCNDGNGCTSGETCQTGVCGGGSPVVCQPLDSCHVAGVCNPGTGLCSNPNQANGTSCDDGSLCTANDACQSGVCTGAGTVCNPVDQCHAANCNPGTGLCEQSLRPNGFPCVDADLCTSADVCTAGVCAGGPVVCDDGIGCTTDSCNPGSGACQFILQPGCQVCGNGGVEPGEECDDGNLVSGDGCNSACHAEILFATKNSLTLPGGVAVTAADIVSFNPDTGAYTVFFKGANNSVGSAIWTGFARLPDGRLLFATSKLFTFPTIGKPFTYDIIAYTPVPGQSPPYTGGTWSIYARLNAAGYSGKINGISVLPNNKIILASAAAGTVPGLGAFTVNDLIEFTPQTIGLNAAGAWAMYFDGSDVAVENTKEILDCGSVDSQGRIALSAANDLIVPGLTAKKYDIVLFTPTSIGDTTAGSFQPLYQGALNGNTKNAAACWIGR